MLMARREATTRGGFAVRRHGGRTRVAPAHRRTRGRNLLSRNGADIPHPASQRMGPRGRRRHGRRPHWAVYQSAGRHDLFAQRARRVAPRYPPHRRVGGGYSAGRNRITVGTARYPGRNWRSRRYDCWRRAWRLDSWVHRGVPLGQPPAGGPDGVGLGWGCRPGGGDGEWFDAAWMEATMVSGATLRHSENCPMVGGWGGTGQTD